MQLTIKKIAFIAGSLFFILGVATLPHYGINWDTINHLPRGQAYLNYFLTGKKDFSNLPKWKDYWQDPDSLTIKSDINKNDIPRRSLYQSDATTFTWFLAHDGNGHPPLSDILSSFFNKVLFQDLCLINDIDSYRVYSISLSAALVFLTIIWVNKAYKSKIASIVAALSLALYPLFWSESHFNNEKDIPETVYWSFLLFCVWQLSLHKNAKWALLSGLFLGLCIGTKFNVLFLPIVVVPWLTTVFLANFPKKKKEFKKYIFPWLKVAVFGGFSTILGIIIFIGTWPYLWADPVSRIFGVLKFYKNIGLTQSPDPRFVGIFHLNAYPITWITITTPLVILLFAMVGISFAFPQIRREKDKLTLLYLLWMIVPILRVTAPGTTVYGGIRQIMEYIPALAIFAGFGAKKISEYLVTKNISKTAVGILLFASFIPITIKLIQIHPNENVYFNPLIGGLSGAKANSIPSWGNTFGSAYREGISWINKNATPNAKLVLTNELLPNVPKIFVRTDLDFHNSQRSGYLRNGEYAMTLVYAGTENRSYYDSYLEKFLKPVYEAKVDDVAVVKVWQNSDKNLYQPWKEEEIKIKKPLIEKDLITIPLEKTENLARLEIYYNQINCPELKSGIVQTSKDEISWESQVGELPNYWKISYLGKQPSNGKFIEPFTGQPIKSIRIKVAPANTCLTQIKSVKVFKLL